MNKNNYCVFDFETDLPTPETCNPVQLGATILNPQTFEPIPGSEFNSGMRPTGIDDLDTYLTTERKQTIQWHARISKCSFDEILDRWRDYPQPKDVWEDFNTYLKRYHRCASKKTMFTAPIASGYNIERFDNIIIKRLCKQYGQLNKRGDVTVFHPRDILDGMRLVFNWLEGIPEVTSYSLDSIRDYFGMPKDNAHDALQDVRDTAWLIERFMKLHHRIAKQVSFKGAYKKCCLPIKQEQDS